MKDATGRFLLVASAAAGFVALAGVLFGYYIGLPSALNFLLHQFTTVQVRPLITIQSYMSFVAMYLFGSALMFQLPLILLIINRIKPLKPKKLLKYERHLIVGAFIVAFIMNPTPNIIDQMLVVVPIIVMYQLGIGLVWFVNRHSNPEVLRSLREQDQARQAERMSRTPAPFNFTDIVPVTELAFAGNVSIPMEDTIEPTMPATPVATMPTPVAPAPLTPAPTPVTAAPAAAAIPAPTPQPVSLPVTLAPPRPRRYSTDYVRAPHRQVPHRGRLVQ
jgi:hypothetical protein